MKDVHDQRRKKLTRGALLLAIAICFQGIRLIFPLPPLVGMFIIGSLVNMTLAVAVRYAGVLPAVLIACLLPVIGFFQGQLAIPLLIPLVAIGNVVFILVCYKFWEKRILWLSPFLKMMTLYLGALFIISFFAIPVKLAALVLMMMGWPQLVTALIGLVLARQLVGKLSLFEER